MKLLSKDQIEQIIDLIQTGWKDKSIDISKSGSAIPIYIVTPKNEITLFDLPCTQLCFCPNGFPSVEHKNVYFAINGGWSARDRYTMDQCDIGRLFNVFSFITK